MEVYNVAGKADTPGLADFVKLKGQPNKLLATEFVMVAGVPVNSRPYLVSRDCTPIAGLVPANEVLLMPAVFGSPADWAAHLGALRLGCMS